MLLRFKSELPKALRQTTSLHLQIQRNFENPLKKRKQTPKDLEKYDLVIVGGNLGAILSNHFDAEVHGHHSIMSVFDSNINQQYPIRVIYEQQRCTKTDYLLNAKLGVNKYAATSEGVGLQEFLPAENAIVLRNGRKIKYEYLVVANGLRQNMGLLKNFEKAWMAPEVPVFTAKDYLGWSVFLHKYPRFIYNFVGGDAYFCIPPYPYAGEIENFNFFLAQDIWRWYSKNGKLSPNHSFTIINANEKFCHHNESADAFIKSELEKRGVKVEYGINFLGLEPGKQIAHFENVKTKKVETRVFSNLYSLLPCEPHESLIKSGLATKESNFLLDVDRETLQHKKYKNIFGLGDACNLPTTKGFFGGIYQLHVVRNNLARSFNGQELDGRYSGYCKLPLFLGQNRMTYVEHYFDEKSGRHHLSGKNGGIVSNLRYYYYGKLQKKKFLGLYLFKNWGPPGHKFKTQFEPFSVRFNRKIAGLLGKLMFWKPKAADAHGHGHHHGKEHGKEEHGHEKPAAAASH